MALRSAAAEQKMHASQEAIKKQAKQIQRGGFDGLGD
jgi:hypothetical protein